MFKLTFGILYPFMFSIILSMGYPLRNVTSSHSATKVQVDSLFPQSWEGVWKGDLKIYNGPSLSMTVPMQLHILPIEGRVDYTWKLIYGEDIEAGLRDYELILTDPKKGIYTIDEKNGIRIENRLLGSTLSSSFEVMNSLLFVTIEKLDDHLHYEIIAGKSDNPSISGDTIIGEQSIPEVKTYPLGVIQRAVLTKEY